MSDETSPTRSQAWPLVLLVDDVEANLIALEGELEKLHCTPMRARSGNEALALLVKHDFALVLLDVQMPQMNGYEVASYARANPTTKNVPILFVTAMHQTEDNALRGYGAGAVDFLFKPIHPVILRGKVQVFLDLYQARQSLQYEIAERKAALNELEAFSYSVSHDLRAPLRPLAGFSRALQEDYADKLDAAGRHYLNRIQAGAQKMSDLIDDLLTLSRMGRAELRARPVDLAAVCCEIVEELRRSEPERNVAFVCVEESPALGDPRLLTIALQNLLRNAWKFTRKIDGATIEFGSTIQGGLRTYFVRDNGVGFDPEHAGRLFQAFQRLHSDAEYEGTGIGLAIVQRIVRRHLGQIWADASASPSSHGATFFFTLGDLPNRHAVTPEPVPPDAD